MDPGRAIAAFGYTRRVTLARVRCWASLPMVFVAACFDPNLPVCLPCDGVCPSGQRCVDGFCAREGESCSAAARDPEPQASRCGPAGCCIGSSCFERADAAAFRIAAWLDWTSLDANASDRTLDQWADRTGQSHTATPLASDQPPRVRPAWFRTKAPSVLEVVSERGYLHVDTTAGDALDQLGRGDFFLLAVAGLRCADRTGRACIASTWPGGPRGLVLAVRPDGRIEANLQDCEDRQPNCADNITSAEPIAACERFQLLGLRRKNYGSATARLELRVDGRTAAANTAGAITFDATAPMYLGGHPLCEHFTGVLATLVAVEGSMSDREACELERALQRSLAAAGMSDVEPATCE